MKGSYWYLLTYGTSIMDVWTYPHSVSAFIATDDGNDEMLCYEDPSISYSSSNKWGTGVQMVTDLTDSINDPTNLFQTYDFISEDHFEQKSGD
jgi:hypothetical protein